MKNKLLRKTLSTSLFVAALMLSGVGTTELNFSGVTSLPVSAVASSEVQRGKQMITVRLDFDTAFASPSYNVGVYDYCIDFSNIKLTLLSEDKQSVLKRFYITDEMLNYGEHTSGVSFDLEVPDWCVQGMTYYLRAENLPSFYDGSVQDMPIACTVIDTRNDPDVPEAYRGLYANHEVDCRFKTKEFNNMFFFYDREHKPVTAEMEMKVNACDASDNVLFSSKIKLGDEGVAILQIPTNLEIDHLEVGNYILGEYSNFNAKVGVNAHAIHDDFEWVYWDYNTSSLSDNEIIYGDSVTVNCSGGGIESCQYAVYYKQDGKSSWTTAQDYRENTVVSVKPKHVGNYTIRVKAKDADGNVKIKNLRLRVNATLKNTSVVLSDTITAGNSVTVIGHSIGGLGDKDFEIWFCNPKTKKWTKKKGFSEVNTATIKLTSEGTYTIRVKVKDERGKIVKKDLSVKVLPALKNTSTVSAFSIRKGESVTVTGSSTGGLGSKQYEFWYYSPKSKKWTKKLDYSDVKTTSIKLAYEGTYTIRVKVKDESGREVRKDLSVKVTK